MINRVLGFGQSVVVDDLQPAVLKALQDEHRICDLGIPPGLPTEGIKYWAIKSEPKEESVGVISEPRETSPHWREW